MIVEIDKKKIPLYPGFAVIKRYCILTGKPLSGFDDFVQSLSGGDMNVLADDIAMFVLAAIQRTESKESSDYNVNHDDIIDWMFAGSMNNAMKLITECIGSISDVKEPGKQKKSQN